MSMHLLRFRFFWLLAGLPAIVVAQARAQFPIALNYNFNGIVHAGEAGSPDDPDGYRSIADRGLFFGGLTGPLFASYSLVGAAGELDIVHLGNRNTVAGGSRAFEAMPGGANGDNGIQPAWLADADQAGPQVSVLASPFAVESMTTASFLYQVSNGGGEFDVRFAFDSGPDLVRTLSAPDWFSFGDAGSFGGPGAYQATEATDRAAGSPDTIGLRVSEGVIDLGPAAGRLLTSISFENGQNAEAGYAIIAANLNVPEPTSLGIAVIGLATLARRRRR